MRALLIQHGCEAVLEVLPADMEGQTKAEQNKKAHNAMILCLGNKVLREVTRETTAAGVWLNLQTLYMTKSLANKLYLKKKLHTFYMPVGRKISEHIDEFNKLVPDLSNIELGDNRECKIRGIGKVMVQLKDGSSFVLQNVKYILELKRNLISLGTLKKEGYTVKLQSGKIKVINGSRAILSGIRRDNCVYSLDGHAMAGELNASVKEKDSLAHVWHKRLGHISEAGLQVLEKQGLFGKKILDLWGPSQVESLGGKTYFLSIVNDYSRRVWVYILRFKHKAFGKFKEWKHFVKNQTWRTVKKLRTDNGLEFCNWEFEQLCIESRIARHLTVAGMPQQNRVAEHINIALMDKDSGANDKSVKELQVEVVIQRLNNHTLKEDQTDQEDVDDEDAGDQATDQPPNLTDYQLVWDREPRIRTKPLRFRDENYELEQLDVKTAFLHGNLEEVIYMRQTPGYEQGNKVCLLNKSLYRLKQSPRQWYKRFDEYMLCNMFKRSNYDSCVYYKNYTPGEYIYLLLYVDDMLTACKSKAKIGSTNSLLKKEFDMKDLREAKKILGIEIVRDRSRKILRVSQSGYVFKILNNFKIDNEKSVKMPLGGHFKLSLKDCPGRDCNVERMKVTYENVVGSLMYLMLCTRADIAYVVSVISRYLENPGKNHWEALKWILKYLRDYAKDLDKVSTGMCCKLEGNATTRGGSFNYRGRVYGSYEGCEGSYLTKGTLGRDRRRAQHCGKVLKAKTVKVLKVGTKHNVVDALTKVRENNEMKENAQAKEGEDLQHGPNDHEASSATASLRVADPSSIINSNMLASF
nr:retrovirus-related Pol polyprotein from transposon TNT 1-94 [Tanacetum cinerariifolium]